MNSNRPLFDFFDRWSKEFTYDLSQPANSEFARLSDTMGWTKTCDAKENAYREFKDALTKQFNFNYGTDENCFESWKLLCVNIGIDPVPDTLEAVRKVVKKTYVNLVDLTDGFEGGRKIPVFQTELALSKYTKLNKRVFPRGNAHAGGLLKHLLRRIRAPPQHSPAPGVSRARKRRSGS
ncbi:hypothetical protein CPB83DRAFT_816601 [Crepidotus variabilis]|uniref:Uncharacterized protein n=1 Tax=Crepidotus variabilis TaxID=179855 RepID=A0A9P6EC24_9AGAR|nr:hypothetical protein CPB83DRAFT_816601 [Crepidotus variabilis]